MLIRSRIAFNRLSIPNEKFALYARIFVGHDASTTKKLFQIRKLSILGANLQSSQIFSALQLKTFTDAEILSVYNKHRSTEGGLTKIEIRKLVRNIAPGKYSDEDIERFTSQLMHSMNKSRTGIVSAEEFNANIKFRAEQIDPRIWTPALSFIFAGISLGIVVPCMPILVQELHIPPSEFGLVVSIVGVAKLLGNIPAAHYVETLGRKPTMVGGLILCSLGLGGISLCLLPGFGTPWLLMCRFITGLGVSFYSSGAYMFMTDISTPLNRTRTVSPIMASFSAGMAMGPALGGFMIGYGGLSSTYFTVGGLFATLTVFNHMVLLETKPSPPTITIDTPNNPPSLSEESARTNKPTGTPSVFSGFQTSYVGWRSLLQRPEVFNVTMLSIGTSVASSAAQMTMLPLFLVGPQFSMSPYEVGGTFAFISVVSVLGSFPSAWLADKVGKVPCIVAGEKEKSGGRQCGCRMSLRHMPSSFSLSRCCPFPYCSLFC